MKCMADTIVKYILEETERSSGVLRFVLPSYPSELLLTIGCQLEERFSRKPDLNVDMKYGIAYRLGQEWQNGTAADKANFARICEKGWDNKNDNLTSLRNMVKGPNYDCLVVLLAGYEHIDDRASLGDFFHLNQETVWELCLKKSFSGWVTSCLKEYVNPDGSERYIEQIAEVFKALYDHALTDILGVSCYLEKIDFSAAMTCKDAYSLILNNLSPFKLPCMNGLVNSKRSFSSYINPAQNFFNYGIFLEPLKRKETIEKIEKFKAEQGDEQLETDILGSFDSLELLLKALEDYIENRSESARMQLYNADFIYIHDQILKYKPKGTKKKRKNSGVKKLYGLPPEVFLRALWITLGDFKKESEGSLLAAENLSSITLQSTAFIHHFDEGDPEENNENAKIFLCQVLGGIDDFFETHLQNLGNANVNSHLCPGTEGAFRELSYRKAGTAVPTLKFGVIITPYEGEPCKREFTWALPQNHQSRLLVDLYHWALKEFRESGNALPVFAVPFMKEIFMAADEETVNRLIGIALQNAKCFSIDLLAVEGFDNTDAVKPLLEKLSIAYQCFLKEFETAGFFSALNTKYDHLHRAYCAAYENYLEQSDKSGLGPLLFKAFMIVADDDIAKQASVWDPYQNCMVVTPLHPALLEMIYHQQAFLCKSLCYYARKGLEEIGEKFSEKTWDQIVDLAKIKWPVFGTLKNEDRALDTNVRSYDYIHLVGECDEDPTSINARLLLEYDDNDDGEITDTDLFRETCASVLIEQVLRDYCTLHPYADDGISIAAYCGAEVQPFIAGVDSYLSSILKDRDGRLYALQLTVFSDSGDDSTIMKWINAWRERWQEAELSSSKRHYNSCEISIACRVVSRDKDYEQFRRLLQGIEVDVMFFMDFIKFGSSHFELLANDALGSDLKFPVLERVCCPVTGGGRDNKRERVLSNQRFKMGALHAEVMANIQQRHSDPGQRYAVMSISDFQQWISVIDTVHQHSAWVVCVDPAVDEQLLRQIESDGSSRREIIGFGTGVGSHGENNYTVSTEQFSLVDISKKIGLQISALFGILERDDANRIAESLIREASHIGGLSIVKATGPSEYVRDYIAYAMVRKLLARDDSAFCDEIISLDAFRHWFSNASDKKRPDILRLQANIVDGYFDIRAQIIECKLAKQSEGYLEDARQQIESGLKQLTSRFKPRCDSEVREGIKDRPDQRYWWMQLHRLIASKGETSRPKYQETLQALERLSEGYFSITWQAAAVAFWTDLAGDSLSCNNEWTFNIEDREITISVATAGKKFINKVCLDGVKGDIFGRGSELSFNFVREDETLVPDTGRDTSNVLTVTHVPERILLGSGTAGGRDVYWEFGHPDLPNRHLLVFGASGTGKTYTIQALLCELAKSGQNSLIVDYTNGFTPNQLEPIVTEKLNPKQHVVRMEPLPINPFRRQYDFIDELKLEEDPATTARRVKELFAEVYRLGDQQQSALYNAIRDGVAQDGNSFNLDRLLERLKLIQHEGGPTASSAASIISKLQPFVDIKPFGKEDVDSWEKLFTDTDSRCHIIQLVGFMKDTAQLITEFSLFDLYWYYRASGNKDEPKVIVLDEIQNLDHSSNSPLGQFLTEGRKFGISLILATQTLSNLSKDEKDRLFQASHKLFFKPADTEIRSFAQILADVTNERIDDWVNRLSSLKKGECFSLGYAFNEATGKFDVNWFKIRINPLEQRY